MSLEFSCTTRQATQPTVTNADVNAGGDVMVRLVDDLQSTIALFLLPY